MHLYCRSYQFIFRILSYLLPWRMPKAISGEKVYEKLSSNLKKSDTVLVITDKGIRNLGLLKKLFKELEDKKINYVVYDKTVPNPTVDNVEEALSLYKLNHCRPLIALGGGSSIDLAKAVAARAVRRRTPISKMKGLLKVHSILPPVFAIPTTAGTGSETTVAAVISDSRTHEKYAISDLCLIPKYAVFDTELTLNLPPSLTSTTGLDALTPYFEV